MAKSCKIILSAVNLLHERCFSINQSIFFKNSVHFLNTCIWIYNMFQNCLYYNTVKGLTFKWDIVRIQYNSCSRTERYITFNQFNGWKIQKLFHTMSQNASTQNQNFWITGFCKQMFSKFFILLLTDRIYGVGWNDFSYEGF